LPERRTGRKGPQSGPNTHQLAAARRFSASQLRPYSNMIASNATACALSE
jgi:hypothetical protein